MIAVYVRVSKGKGRGQDTRSQRPDLERWIAADGRPATWYEDFATGTTMERPGLVKLLRALRAGDTLLVWRLDRLGRTTAGAAALFEELQKRKVNFVSLRDGMDLSTSAGRLMAHVVASFAAYETEVRAERVMAGLEVAREHGTRSGKAIGRPKGSKNPAGSRVAVETRDLVLRLFLEGHSPTAISRSIKVARQTVYSTLQAAGVNIAPRGQPLPSESFKPPAEVVTRRAARLPRAGKTG